MNTARYVSFLVHILCREVFAVIYELLTESVWLYVFPITVVFIFLKLFWNRVDVEFEGWIVLVTCVHKEAKKIYDMHLGLGV